MDAKVAAIIESGGRRRRVVLRDIDAYLYGEKLIDVTDIAKEVGKTSGAAGTTSPSRPAWSTASGGRS